MSLYCLYCGGKTFNNWKSCLVYIDEFNRQERAKPFFFNNAFIGDIVGYAFITSLYLHIENLWYLSFNPWTGKRARIHNPFKDCTHTMIITEEMESTIPNIRKGDELYLTKGTCKAGDFIVTEEYGKLVIKQSDKTKFDVFLIKLVSHSFKGDKLPIIHNGNNWFGMNEDEMEKINKTYKFRCKADVIRWEKEQEEKFIEWYNTHYETVKKQ